MNQLTLNQRLLGFIGIGHMGSRIVRCLIDHGYDLTPYNRDGDAAEAQVEQGANVADNVAEPAPQADVSLSCLTNDDSVLSVYTGPQGVFEHARPGSVIIKMSAVFLWTSRELHRFGLEAGVKFLSTPISGSAQAADFEALSVTLDRRFDAGAKFIPSSDCAGT
jgi:3-hydroxyisobutyrate dehydrogenase-like beta-hydroxyacid dehydrogenase